MRAFISVDISEYKKKYKKKYVKISSNPDNLLISHPGDQETPEGAGDFEEKTPKGKDGDSKVAMYRH